MSLYYSCEGPGIVGGLSEAHQNTPEPGQDALFTALSIPSPSPTLSDLPTPSQPTYWFWKWPCLFRIYPHFHYCLTPAPYIMFWLPSHLAVPLIDPLSPSMKAHSPSPVLRIYQLTGTEGENLFVQVKVDETPILMPHVHKHVQVVVCKQWDSRLGRAHTHNGLLRSGRIRMSQVDRSIYFFCERGC